MTNYLLVSTDTHAGLSSEGYRDYIDPSLRTTFDEAAEATSIAKAATRTDDSARFLAEWNIEIGDHGGMQGAFDAEVRTKEMDDQGVAAEVIFPDADSAGVGGVDSSPFNTGLGATGDGDPALVLAGARAHNRWLAEFVQNDPHRRAGVAIVPIGDIPQAVKEIEWAAAHDLRGGIIIPTKWGSRPPYNARDYDPIWAAAAAGGQVVHTHSGVGPDDYGISPGLLSIYTTEAYWWAARPLWALILGGVFERHPTLKYACAENGAWWVPDIVQRMDNKWIGDHPTRKFGPAPFRAELSMKPSDYFRRNCFMAASVMGTIEIDRRHEIGIDNLMWGDDFPHPEGSWPHTRQWVRDSFGGVPEQDARKILGLTAARVYDFDLDTLLPIAERIGPSVAEMHGAAETHSVTETHGVTETHSVTEGTGA